MAHRVELADADRYAFRFMLEVGAFAGTIVALIGIPIVDAAFIAPHDVTSIWRMTLVAIGASMFWGFIMMMVFTVYNDGMCTANLVYRQKTDFWLETGDIKKQYEKLDATSVAAAHLWCVDRFHNARRLATWYNTSTWLTLVMADGRVREFGLRETTGWAVVHDALTANGITLRSEPLYGEKRRRGRMRCHTTIRVTMGKFPRHHWWNVGKGIAIAFLPTFAGLGLIILIHESFLWDIRWLAITLFAVIGLSCMISSVYSLIRAQPHDYLTITPVGLQSREFGLLRWDSNVIWFHYRNRRTPAAVPAGDGAVGTSIPEWGDVMTIVPDKATDEALRLRYTASNDERGSAFGDLISACVHYGRVVCWSDTYTDFGPPEKQIRRILPCE